MLSRIAPSLIAAACLTSAAPPPAVALPPETLLLLVADWCAPCRGELARIDRLAEAAAPYAVRALLVDDNRGGRRMIATLPPARRWDFPAGDRAEGMRALLSGTAGLPYSVAVDRAGRVCGAVKGGLWPAGARGLVARCRAGAPH